MPKIHRIAKTETYQSVRKSSDEAHENNDCTVVAFAIVAGVSYKEAHQAMARQGRKHGQGLWGAEGKMRRELQALGFRMTSISEFQFIAQYPGVHKNIKNVTTHHPARFNKVWANGKTYLFFTCNHVAAVVNGETHDWSNDKSNRVTGIYEIVKA